MTHDRPLWVARPSDDADLRARLCVRAELARYGCTCGAHGDVVPEHMAPSIGGERSDSKGLGPSGDRREITPQHEEKPR